MRADKVTSDMASFINRAVAFGFRARLTDAVRGRIDAWHARGQSHAVFVVVAICCLAYTCLFAQAGIEAAPEGDEAYWQWALYQREHLPFDEGNQVFEHTIKCVKENPTFLKLVQHKLRYEAQASARLYAAAALIKAQGKEVAPEDCLYMLSDPESSIRGLGSGAITVYKMTNLFACLPSMLLREDPLERKSVLRAIEKFFKGRGLPYYVQMLEDEDQDVARKAAYAFGTCRREDAVPHLLSYLEQHGGNRQKTNVVSAVIAALQRLHNEPVAEPSDVRAAANAWVRRLKGPTTVQED